MATGRVVQPPVNFIKKKSFLNKNKFDARSAQKSLIFKNNYAGPLARGAVYSKMVYFFQHRLFFSTELLKSKVPCLQVAIVGRTKPRLFSKFSSESRVLDLSDYFGALIKAGNPDGFVSPSCTMITSSGMPLSLLSGEAKLNFPNLAIARTKPEFFQKAAIIPYSLFGEDRDAIPQHEKSIRAKKRALWLMRGPFFWEITPEFAFLWMSLNPYWVWRPYFNLQANCLKYKMVLREELPKYVVELHNRSLPIVISQYKNLIYWFDPHNMERFRDYAKIKRDYGELFDKFCPLLPNFWSGARYFVSGMPNFLIDNFDYENIIRQEKKLPALPRLNFSHMPFGLPGQKKELMKHFKKKNNITIEEELE